MKIEHEYKLFVILHIIIIFITEKGFLYFNIYWGINGLDVHSTKKIKLINLIN